MGSEENKAELSSGSITLIDTALWALSVDWIGRHESSQKNEARESDLPPGGRLQYGL